MKKSRILMYAETIKELENQLSELKEGVPFYELEKKAISNAIKALYSAMGGMDYESKIYQN